MSRASKRRNRKTRKRSRDKAVELVRLATNNPTGLAGHHIIDVANKVAKHGHKDLVRLLEDHVIELGAPYYIRRFALDVKSADTFKLMTVWRLLGGQQVIGGENASSGS